LFGKEGRAEIGIGVHPKYRNKGVDKLLIQEILREAKNKGIKKVYAGMKKENKTSLDFFASNNFKIYKEILKFKVHIFFYFYSEIMFF
jgi:ribosomal protein S18 acetylase RimI-like enzyme